MSGVLFKDFDRIELTYVEFWTFWEEYKCENKVDVHNGVFSDCGDSQTEDPDHRQPWDDPSRVPTGRDPAPAATHGMISLPL